MTGGNLHQLSFTERDDAERERRYIVRRRWELISDTTRIGLNWLAYSIVLSATLAGLSATGYTLYAIYTDPSLGFVRDFVNMASILVGGMATLVWAVTRLGTME